MQSAMPWIDDYATVEFTAYWVALLLQTDEYSSLIHKNQIDGRLLRKTVENEGVWCEKNFKQEHRLRLVSYFQQLRVQQHQGIRRTSGFHFVSASPGYVRSEVNSNYHSAHRFVERPTSAAPTASAPSTARLAYAAQDHESDPAIYELVHKNYNETPEMKKVFMDFVRSKLHLLPPLVFSKANGNEVSAYSMSFDLYTAYGYFMSRRQQIRADLKRKRQMQSDLALALPDVMSVVREAEPVQASPLFSFPDLISVVPRENSPTAHSSRAEIAVSPEDVVSVVPRSDSPQASLPQAELAISREDIVSVVPGADSSEANCPISDVQVSAEDIVSVVAGADSSEANCPVSDVQVSAVDIVSVVAGADSSEANCPISDVQVSAMDIVSVLSPADLPKAQCPLVDRDVSAQEVSDVQVPALDIVSVLSPADLPKAQYLLTDTEVSAQELVSVLPRAESPGASSPMRELPLSLLVDAPIAGFVVSAGVVAGTLDRVSRGLDHVQTLKKPCGNLPHFDLFSSVSTSGRPSVSRYVHAAVELGISLN
ncbi:hypothetical protein R1sor_001034 [Riccia sorocarpa]|uniref:Uncharacterized protein n=1 Tax=Riccia sorocarpa TaxID=122646 RepID=A0ABD3GUT4_9MARC